MAAARPSVVVQAGQVARLAPRLGESWSNKSAFANILGVDIEVATKFRFHPSLPCQEGQRSVDSTTTSKPGMFSHK